MGRFKPQTEQERIFDWGTVRFVGPEIIDVILRDHTIVFHRFGDSRGSYTRSWSKFRRKLKNHKNYTIYDIHRWAYELEVQHYTKGISVRPDEKIK